MKKILVALVLLVCTSPLFFSEGIDLGAFPKGKWVDSNWNAVWEFGADNIRILDSTGAVVYDFNGKISNFKVDVGLTDAKISFTCKDAERKYVFTKGIKDLDLVMKINPEWTDKDYTVTMAFQK